MHTKFYSLAEKADIVKRLQSASDKLVIKVVVEEIQRLESIIKGYEIALDAAASRLEMTNNKLPSKLQ